MKVHKEKSQGELIITITIEADDLKKAKQRVAKKLSRELRIPGFRPGKVPYQVLLRYLGGEKALLEAVFEEYLFQWLEKALEPHLDEIADLELMERPEIQGLEEGAEELTITVRAPAVPTAELGPLPSPEEIEQEPVEIPEEAVEEALTQLQEEHATWIPTSGPAEYGDLITIDLEGRLLTGELVADLKDHEIRLPSESEEEEEEPEAEKILVPGQETQAAPPERFWSFIRGMSVGQTREFSIAYPEDWPHELTAGRTVLYRVTLKDLKKPILPALDDELAQMVGDFETLEELREQVRKDIQATAEEQAKDILKLRVLDKLVEASQIEISPRLIEHRVEEIIEEIENRLKAQGLSLDEYLQHEGKTRDEYVAELREKTERDIKRATVLSAYGKERNITVSPDEAAALMAIAGILPPPTVPIEVAEAMFTEYTQRVFVRKALNKLLAEVMGEPEEPLPEVQLAEELKRVQKEAQEETPEQTEEQPEGEEQKQEQEAEKAAESAPAEATSREAASNHEPPPPAQSSPA